MNKDDRTQFAALLAARKEKLIEEIRRVLARSGSERYADLVSGVPDTADAAIADLLADVTHAEVARDVNELRDVAAAEARLAAGTYGVCIDCGTRIRKERLKAYPTAKRCLEDQQRREKLRAGPAHPRA